MARNNRQVQAAAIYCRISQDRSDEELGVERQEALCRKLADEKGWPVAEVYVDNDISAFSGKRRPRYEALLADVEARHRDAILAVDQDRLVRRVSEVDHVIRLCERNDTPILLASGEVDMTTADGILKAHILASVAENESRKKSERLCRQREQAAKRGTPVAGGRRAFGYDNDKITIRRDEAKIVRELAKRFLAGDSLRTLAFDLNDREVPTVTGGRWGVTTLREMLTNWRYAGLRVHRGEVVGQAVWKPILDVRTVERIRSVLGDPRRTRRGRPPTHLLTGLVYCARCGHKMHTNVRSNGSRRHHCNRTPAGGCGAMAITAEPLERLITAAVLRRLSSPAVNDAFVRHHNVQDADGVDDLADLERELEDLARDYGEQRITRREWLAAREPLERRRDSARRALARTTDRHVLDCLTSDDINRAWTNLSLERRRAVLAALIDRIVINAAAPGGRRFNADRVDVVWRA